ncbi:MAG: divalent metal cation transporter [Verrucomicrobiae bacterium]|nr:divalent metal cation transporter [Verrucomicrobiae bacterium]
MKRILQSVGPAIIVAAVVLGPGSILTSSKVGATFGLAGVPVIAIAAILMIGMVALAARLGAVYEGSPCDELASRLGRPIAVIIGAILFGLVALFQSSNNLAVIAGIEPLFKIESTGLKVGVLVVTNLFVIGCLYAFRDLYGSVEKLMKLLIGMMVVAFLVNFGVAWISPRGYVAAPPTGKPDLIPLLGMIGTTFSVGGAFYQAYLVKEKGWGIGDVRKGVIDSTVSISVLGLVTAIILLTSMRVFYGRPDTIALNSVGDIALQLEPLFGPWAKVVFCIGIFAGAFSSFLVNAMIGGTVMSDSLKLGSRLDQRGPLHLTTVALLVGMSVAIASVVWGNESTVTLITIAQALTVLGLPALAAALIYLGTRKELTGDRKVPRWILTLSILGFFAACYVSSRLATAVYQKLNPPAEETAAVAEAVNRSIHRISI